MPRTGNMELGGRLICLFVGENKSGKTAALATFPGPIKIYNFDGPGRMTPIKYLYPDIDLEYVNVGPKAINHPNPDLCVISFVDFCQEFERLQDNCPYGTVAIDSFTSLSTTAVTFQLMARLGDSWNMGKMKTTKGGLPIASWDEFNGETTAVAMILDVAKILPCHVVMTAHPLPKTETNKDGEVIRRYTTIASFGTKVDKIVPGYFTEIWRFIPESSLTPGEKARYYFYTTPVGVDYASTALPLPGKVEITKPRRAYQEVVDLLKKADEFLKLDAKTIVIK
jgi:hypothetical protein